MGGNPAQQAPLASFTRRAVTAAITVAAIVSVATISVAQRASASPSTQAITLNTGGNWTEGFDYTNTAAAVYLDSQGVVHLEGAVDQLGSSGSDLIGWLPADFPNRTVYTIVHTFDGTYADIDIRPNGQIWLYRTANANTAFVSLEGVSWYDGDNGGVQAITPLNSYWSTTGGSVSLYDAFPAGAYQDGDGTVHLQGAAQQLQKQNQYPQLIGTLPAGLSPGRNVFTIVPTFGGPMCVSAAAALVSRAGHGGEGPRVLWSAVALQRLRQAVRVLEGRTGPEPAGAR
jgi:hypothetical protein